MTGQPEVRVYVEATSPTSFTVRDEAGNIIVKASRSPEVDACRILRDRGITGTLVTRWKGSSHDSLRIDIEKMLAATDTNRPTRRAA